MLGLFVPMTGPFTSTGMRPDNYPQPSSNGFGH